LSARIHRADSLETLVDSILLALEESFGFSHSMFLVPAEEKDVLVTIATRGYSETGVGAEVRLGEGICGMVAEARKPIRISGLMRGILYALAMHREAQNPDSKRRRIPLPGLPNPESQLGVPLLVRGELVGVLCVESEVPYRFHEEDKASIELLGGYLAIAIQNMQWQEHAADSAGDAIPTHKPSETVAGVSNSLESRNDDEDEHELVYYGGDECILIDGEYLIRGLPAKILWRLLSIREATGREEFTNRELRLDKSLNLPEWKDNLESRLLLLRRRLEQKCPAVRLTPRCRGRFAIEVASPVTLNAQP